MSKKIVHIDLNAFFAQAEILKDPSLADKPIAIGGEAKRSVVSTASYEARKYGVGSGMPVSEAKRLCPQLILISGNYHYYSNLSHKFFGYLHALYPIMEKASIDECYIDMTDEIDKEDAYGYLFDLQLKLYKVTRLKCSIGMGSNKFLAKMGSDLKKPLGLTIIEKEDIESVLWPLDISKMYGIGKKTAPRLKALSINTIGDLAKTDSLEVKTLLGSMFEYFKGEANGIGDDFVDTSAYDPKSISAERTFHEDINSYEDIRTVVLECCKEIYEKLIKYQKAVLCLGIKFRRPNFQTTSKRRTLDKAITTVDELFYESMRLVDDYYDDKPLRLLGISCEKVIDKKDLTDEA